MDRFSLGEVLLSLGLVSEKNLQRCLEFQDRLNNPKPLGEILVGQGLISSKILSSILDLQKRRRQVEEEPGETAEDGLRERLKNASIQDFLKVSRELKARSLYLTSGMQPSVRLHGNLVDLPTDSLTFDSCRDLLFSLLGEEQITEYYEKKALEFDLAVPEAGRFRCSLFRHYSGIGAVFRVIPEAIVSLESLSLPPRVADFTNLKNGLVLVTGPSGSGKTTTLAALVDLINRHRKVHVITLEDPIEVIFDSDQAFVTQRQINRHSRSFGEALKSALREDSDVIVVSELTDRETIETALTAAETGNLVIGTMHTRNACSTILRIVDQFSAEKHAQVRSLLSGVLRGVICQELVPNRDGMGLSLACEIMIVNRAVANLIRENRIWQIPMVMQLARAEGMMLMDDSLKALVDAEKITVEEALSRAKDCSKLLAAEVTNA